MTQLALICSGQGKQSPEMFDALLAYPAAAALYGELKETVFAGGDPHDPGTDIFHNEIAQPALCLYQMMVWAVLRPVLPEVELFAGYSLGELSAYACAGVLTPAQLVKLAGIRGRLMTAAAKNHPQSMAGIIGLSRERIDELCARFSGAVAIINGADHFVCGLPEEKVEECCSAALARGAIRAVPIPVTVASHTFFMDRAAEAFRPELEKVSCAGKFGRVIAGVDGAKVFSRDRMIETLCGQMHRTIDWRAGMESARSYGCRIFLELGPGSALTRMLTETYPDVQARSVSDFHDLNGVPKWLAAVSRRLDG